MEEQAKRGPGRPKKVEEVPEFDQSRSWGVARPDGKKFIVQGRNYFSYAEGKGAFNEELQQRVLEPPPKFIIKIEDYELEQKHAQRSAAKLRLAMEEEKLKLLERELEKGGFEL